MLKRKVLVLEGEAAGGNRVEMESLRGGSHGVRVLTRGRGNARAPSLGRTHRGSMSSRQGGGCLQAKIRGPRL